MLGVALDRFREAHIVGVDVLDALFERVVACERSFDSLVGLDGGRSVVEGFGGDDGRVFKAFLRVEGCLGAGVVC